MGRVLYGIHGTGHGHAMRGLTLARALPQHEFLFVANDDAPKVLEPEFRVVRIPNLGTVFRNYKADISRTVAKSLPILCRRQKYIDETLRIIDDFKPNVCMTDLEYFVPQAAKRAGLPCLTLDHQHVITCCQHTLPGNMLWDSFIQGLTPRYLFQPTEANIIISFYNPPVKPGINALIAPPILREKTIRQLPSDAGHILVYQSNSTDQRLIDFLRKFTRRKVHIFGYRETEEISGHLHFHKRSEDKFLELLASCAFVIQGGSHTLMSEALYFGKPILSIPLAAMVEQRFNALYLERSGYGLATTMAALDNRLMEEFEDSLVNFRTEIKKKNFFGNPLVFDLIDRYISTSQTPRFGNSLPLAGTTE